MQRHHIKRFIPAASLFALLAAVGLSLAGPLTPPSGPITSTYKTLVDVEPRIAITAANTPGDATNLYRITQPGSYYLTGNIVGGPSRSGIAILASNVTLDLMGFTVQGVTGSLSGITTGGTELNNLTVRNGIIIGWGADGLDLGNAGAGGRGGAVEGIHSSANGGLGIRPNSHSTVSDCTAIGNAGDGIYAFFACTITRCISSYNSGDGFEIGDFCRVVSNTCYANGYLTADAAGIHATGNKNHIEDNQCNSADRGIDIDGDDNLILNNRCGGNTVNWSIVSGNNFTAVLDHTLSPNSGFNGNSANSNVFFTEPSSNISY